MSYREGGGYGHGGYHSELPPAQLGNTLIDPEEFPHVVSLLHGTSLGPHPSSSAGSTGYPEDAARHLYVGPNGSHYYTSDTPGHTAPYTGYNYIPAPDSGAPTHAFAGATIRSPVDAGFHGRARYEAGPDGYAVLETESEHHENERPYRTRHHSGNYYKPSGEYIVPAGTIPRASTKTPTHADAANRRQVSTSVHQSRPPNSRHSSSENGDSAEIAYHNGRYDKNDYNPPRPKSARPRPNSFSYNRGEPRPIESDPAFRNYKRDSADGMPIQIGDPRSSTGSLGNSGIRYGTTAPVVHQGGSGYYRGDAYGDGRSTGAMVHTPGMRHGRTYNRDPRASQPLVDPGYAYYQAEEREDFEDRRRRRRSKSRFRTRTPGPDDRPLSEDERAYRARSKSRPASPSAAAKRARSRRRKDSPSPPSYAPSSRMRSRSRPRGPEVVPARTPRGNSPTRSATAPSRPKTPLPESAQRNPPSTPEEIVRAKEIQRERELQDFERERDRERDRERERDRAERERIERERTERERIERESIERERIERERIERENEKEQERNKEREREREREREQTEREKESSRERRHRRKHKHKDRDSESPGSERSDWDRERKKDKERRRKEEAKEEAAKNFDPALANPMVENMNPKRERAGVQPGQVFIRPDLLCAMSKLGLCVVEGDPTDDHAHNMLMRLDCGHGYHEDCLRSMISSRERISMGSVNLDADKLWCERCRNMFGKKAGM